MMADSHLQSGGQFIYDAQISTFDLNATYQHYLLGIIIYKKICNNIKSTK